MLIFTTEETFREAGVVSESAEDRDCCSALLFRVNALMLHLLKGVLHVGVDGFALRCNNTVLFSPIGRVGVSPGLRAGSGLKHRHKR